MMVVPGAGFYLVRRSGCARSPIETFQSPAVVAVNLQ